jgi:hypothetical protein
MKATSIHAARDALASSTSLGQKNSCRTRHYLAENIGGRVESGCHPKEIWAGGGFGAGRFQPGGSVLE